MTLGDATSRLAGYTVVSLEPGEMDDDGAACIRESPTADAIQAARTQPTRTRRGPERLLVRRRRARWSALLAGLNIHDATTAYGDIAARSL